MKKAGITLLFTLGALCLLAPGLYSQVKFDLGLGYTRYIKPDSTQHNNGLSFYVGVVGKVDHSWAWQAGAKVLLHGGNGYHPHNLTEPVGHEEYLALSLLLPVNGVCQIPQSRWSVAVGPALGYHQLKRMGNTTPYLIEHFNYSRIRIKKENVCAGYQVALLFKKTDIFNFMAEYAYTKSRVEQLSGITIGFQYFI